MRKIVKTLIITALIAVISLCGYELWKISDQYAQEARIREAMSKYYTEAAAVPDKEKALPTSDAKVNQWLIDMQNEVNRDIVGWLFVPETLINYPFVQAADNNFYLRRDLHGENAIAGSLFMDYRCSKDFADFNTIIYGHNMKNNGMFGDLSLFADEGFFESHPGGTVHLSDNSISLEFFACMIVSSNDVVIYNPSSDRDVYFEYVRENALNYRKPESWGNVVTLSTCSYEFSDARIVLLAYPSPTL